MIENGSSVARTPLRETAVECTEAGIEAAHPETVIPDEVELRDETLMVSGEAYDLSAYEDVVIIGGGNVAGHAAAALENILEDRISEGAIVTDDPVATDTVEVVEGDYPTPSQRGMAGARRVLDIANEAGEDDLVITILSGGGSALLPAPTAAISLGDLQNVTNLLYERGLNMKEINMVRKHLSAVKGGRLAETIVPATCIALVFSDIVGNELEWIASGPISPDSSTFADAISVLDRYDIDVPDRVHNHLERGYRGAVEDTPDPDDPVFERVYPYVLADGLTALEGAQRVAEEKGYDTRILWSHTRGDAEEIAKTQIGIVREIRESGNPVEPPAVVLTGGDITVSTDGNGSIGPNQAFALSAAIEAQMEGISDFALASVATEGIDGLGDCEPAGGLVDGTTAVPENEAWDALRRQQVSSFLDANDDLVETGVTGTNVNDIHVLVVGEQ